MSESFNYRDKTAASLRLTPEFKQKFIINIQGKDTVKLEGLTALAHQKGMWKLVTHIIQFPDKDNNFTAICETTVGGYDYDPITDKVREVVYTDIGDANASNCTKRVAPAFIRMASTRSQARALRKYINIDMVCMSEMDSTDEPIVFMETQDAPPPPISTEQLVTIKGIVKEKGITPPEFNDMLMKLFARKDFMKLTFEQGSILIEWLKAYDHPKNPQS